MATSPIILDSVTHLKPEHRGAVTYSASHAGRYACWYAAEKGISAIILNDAGIGREQAGINGLALLEGLNVPAAAISHRSARIGDGQDGVSRGVLSFVNAPAKRLGLGEGMRCRDALQKLCAADLSPAPKPPAEHEARYDDGKAGKGGRRVIVMDSISLVQPDDAGQVVVAASHGAILGGRPETAVKYDVFAVVTCDADRGIDDAGISRLPALQARGIAGACVSAFSARIGDGRSVYEDGYISVLNEIAKSRGGRVGQSCCAFVAAMVSATGT